MRPRYSGQAFASLREIWVFFRGLNPCMLRCQPRSLFGGHLNKAATCPDFSGKRHLNRRTPWSLCRPVGISTTSAASLNLQTLVCCTCKPRSPFGGHLNRPRLVPVFGAAASQQAGEAGVSTSREAASQPSNPQPAQPVFPNHFVSGTRLAQRYRPEKVTRVARVGMKAMITDK